MLTNLGVLFTVSNKAICLWPRSVVFWQRPWDKLVTVMYQLKISSIHKWEKIRKKIILIGNSRQYWSKQWVSFSFLSRKAHLFRGLLPCPSFGVWQLYIIFWNEKEEVGVKMSITTPLATVSIHREPNMVFLQFFPIYLVFNEHFTLWTMKPMKMDYIFRNLNGNCKNRIYMIYPPCLSSRGSCLETCVGQLWLTGPFKSSVLGVGAGTMSPRYGCKSISRTKIKRQCRQLLGTVDRKK